MKKTEEVNNNLTLKNGKLVEVARVFRKISGIEMDFDNMEEMTSLLDDSILIETALKTYSKLEEKVREDAKVKLKGLSNEQALEVETEFVKLMNALSDKESSLERPLKKVSQSICKKAKLTLAEYRVLKELELT